MTRKVTEPFGKKIIIVMKFVKFRNVTEKESTKKAKGVYLVKKGCK